MMRAPGRSSGFNASFSASPLVRQLTRLAEVEAPEPRQAFAERLSQWLGWTDAIALSAALGTPAAATGNSAVTNGQEVGHETATALRTRTALAKTLADEPAPAPPRARSRPPPPDTPAMDPFAPADFTPHRRRYHARQQAMDAAIGPLRARLRATLAARSPALARLAAVDAVMEQALGERERGLLSVVPVLLEKRFDALRQAHAADASARWLARFRQDMHQLLLAELEHRWLPIDGLLAALRDAPSPTPAP